MAIEKEPAPYFKRYLDWLAAGGGLRKPPGEQEMQADEHRKAQKREAARRKREEEERQRALEERKRELAKLDERWPPGSWWWVRVKEGLYEARGDDADLPAVGVALRHVPEGQQFERGWLLPGVEAWSPLQDDFVKVIARVEPPEEAKIELADALLHEDE